LYLFLFEVDAADLLVFVELLGFTRLPQLRIRLQPGKALPLYPADSSDCEHFGEAQAARWLGIREVLTAPQSPWQNPYVERLIGSIRRECLDHVIVLNETGLRRILKLYCDYYERTRTHLGLEKDAPIRRPVQLVGSGRIVAIPQVGGLHHRYERIAARTFRFGASALNRTCVSANHCGKSPRTNPFCLRSSKRTTTSGKQAQMDFSVGTPDAQRFGEAQGTSFGKRHVN
jgi:hypothetical protein